jgi:hypothetical protein
MANTDVVMSTDVDRGENSSHIQGGTDMLRHLLHMPRGVEGWVALPIECMMPLAGTDHMVIRVIDDGAAGAP